MTDIPSRGFFAFRESLATSCENLFRRRDVEAQVATQTRPGLTHGHIVIVVSAIFLLSNALIAPGLHPVAGLLVMLACAGSLFIVVRAVGSRTTGFLARRVDPAIFGLSAL